MAIRLLSNESIDGTLTLTGNLTGTNASFTRLDINAINTKLKGDLLGNADAAYDIGASGANRPRNLFLSNSIQAADATFTGSVTASNFIGTLPTGQFLPLTGGTLSGALTGTSATFSGSITGTTATFTPISTVSFIVTNSGNALRLISGVPSGVTWIGKPVQYYASEYSFSTDVTGAGSYSQQFVIENNGDVGIGVSSPIKKLQVSGFETGDLINILCVNRRDQDGDTASIGFSMTDNNLYNKAAVIFERTTTQGRGSLHFATNNTGSSANVSKGDARMTILTDGNVGIGTTSPQRKLDVKSNDTTPSAYLRGGKSSQGEIQNTGLIIGTQTDMAAGDYQGISFTGYTSVNAIARGRAAIGVKAINGPGKMDLVFMAKHQDDGTQLLSDDIKMVIKGSLTSNKQSRVGIGYDFAASKIHEPEGTNALDVYGTGFFGYQDFRDHDTYPPQKVLVLRGAPASGAYAQSRFNWYTKSGTTSNGIAAIQIKSQYGTDGESGVLFHFGGSGNLGIGTDSPVSTWLNTFDPTTGNGTFKLTSEGWIVTPYLTGLAAYYPGQGARPIMWSDVNGTNIQSWDNDASDGISLRSSNGSTKLIVREDGKVGIGTTLPGQLLHLNDGSTVTSTDANNMLLLTRNNHSYVMFSCPDEKDSGFHFHNTTDNSFVGRIAYSHEAAGDKLFFRVGGSEVFTLFSNGNATLTGTLTQNSDITLKENIKPLQSQLKIVSKLNPVSYNKIGQKENEVGFIAQEVEKLLPELVREDKDGLKSLAYGNMNAILVKAIQELKAEIELLKKK